LSNKENDSNFATAEAKSRVLWFSSKLMLLGMLDRPRIIEGTNLKVRTSAFA
jgi:hypothetical protein